MLKRLRRAHPVGYCLLTEVVFLAVLMVVPVLLVLLLAALGVDLTRVDDYFLSAIQELLGALVAVFFLKKTGRLGLLRRELDRLLRVVFLGPIEGQFKIVIVQEFRLLSLVLCPAGSFPCGQEKLVSPPPAGAALCPIFRSRPVLRCAQQYDAWFRQVSIK